MILAIISVIVEQCSRNTNILYVQLRHDQSPTQKHVSGDGSTMKVHAYPTRTSYRGFQKSKQNKDDGDVFWSILSHVNSLLKLNKDVEDDNRYCFSYGFRF